MLPRNTAKFTDICLLEETTTEPPHFKALEVFPLV